MLFVAAGILEPVLPMEVGARAPGGEVLIAAGTFGAGTVVILSDMNGFTNIDIGDVDNQRFAENLFDQLTAATVPTLSTWALLLFSVLLLSAGLRVSYTRRQL